MNEQQQQQQQLHRSNRHVVATRVKRFNRSTIRQDLLRAGPAVQGDFRTLDTALTAVAKTSFGIYDDGRRILIAVCLRDLSASGETVEVLFNPWNDGIGYYQFLITPQRVDGPYHFIPYPEAHSTAFRHMRLINVKWEPRDFGQADESGPAGQQAVAMAWMFAWFDAAEVFRQGGVAGFNLARTTGKAAESTTWNPCSGHGMQDASSFGRLYRSAPSDWSCDTRIERTPASLCLSGCGLSGQRLRLRLLDPLGDDVAAKTVQRRGKWSLSAVLKSPVAGRYRIYAEGTGKPCEPRYLAFDVPPADDTPFTATMTYDIPDDIICDPVPYTPEALGAELDLMRAHGITRIHWIDYPPETLYAPKWVVRSPNAALTRKRCGDLLPLAARLAKARGLAFIGLFKPFDIAIDGTNWRPDANDSPVPGHCVRNLEGRNVWVPAAVARSQDCIQQAHDAWFPEGNSALPVRFRLYSREPLFQLGPADLQLWVSPDNLRYTPYRGPMKLKILRLKRPHQRWTAAGNIAEAAQEIVYALELSDLKLRSRYAALELKTDVVLTGRAHAFAEAWGDEGHSVPVTLATHGNCENGFTYWQEWKSWANTSPRMLEDVCWGKGFHGLVFDRRRAQPTLLEPCCEGARDIWLWHVQRILDTEADGVGIRTLCHHNNVMDYLSMAFAPAVRASFRAEHGREPEPTWDDAVRIRVIRGRAYTDFLRQTKGLAVQAGKRMAVHLEAGIEVPPACDQRMQINLEWETWIREGIADEIVLKWWFSQNPFIQEQVLPLARKYGVPVYIVDRNNSLNNTPRAIERAVALATDSRLAGFAGYAWYEAANCKRRNSENVPEFRMHIGEAIRRSARAASGQES